VSRKFIKASPISAPSMRIIEDVYRRDLVVHFGVHVRVIVKALMKFDTRYIAKGHLFAVFDCLLSSIFKGGGLSITSVNMLQALPNVTAKGNSARVFNFA
jgi:hypothetical protein